MKKTITIAGVLSLLVLSIAVSFAGKTDGFSPFIGMGNPSMVMPTHQSQSPGMPFFSRVKQMVYLMDKLELSQVQRHRIWKIIDTKRPQVRLLVTALLEGRKNLQQAAMSGVDEAITWKMAQSQGQSIANLIMLRIQIISQLQTVLSPNQQEKVKALIQKYQGFSKNDTTGQGSVS